MERLVSDDDLDPARPHRADHRFYIRVVDRGDVGALPAETILATLLVAIAVASLTTGALIYLLGHFQLANLTRFIPYPVVCGFLAGSGWLLVTGSIRAVTGHRASIFNLGTLAVTGKLQPWWPCAAYGITLFVTQLRIKHWSVFVCFLAVFAGGFYPFLAAMHISLDQARAAGWLVPTFVHTAHALNALDILRLAQWKQLLPEAGSFAAISLTTVVSILLNSSAMEIEIGREVDLNQELRATGIANLLCGCVGGMVGFSSLSPHAHRPAHRARTRLVGFTLAALCGICFLGFPQIVGYIPKFILGGLLLYLGLQFFV